MQADHLKTLIRKYNAGTLTAEEKSLLDAWYLQLSRKEQIDVDEADMRRRLDAVWNQLLADDQTGQRRAGRGWIPYAAAAAIGLMLLSGSWLYRYLRPAVTRQHTVNAADIPPGGNRAVLTLADGSRILLDKAAKGQLSEAGGVRVVKVESGLLSYDGSADAATERYHTLSTPRGGQYRVVLPDGTRVWLNASSTLRYPSRFSGLQRRVSLSGEGYFEVAAEPRPFVVATALMEAKVLGTHFNMRAYEEETVRTTLLEGSLFVTAGSAAPGSAASANPVPEQGGLDPGGREARNGRLLRPGQEAVLEGGRHIAVREADTERAVAWKNGLFSFRNDSLAMVMRQLARWYDVEIVYQGEIPDKVFTGEIYRSLNASQVLEILDYTGLQFSIQGKQIIVKE